MQIAWHECLACGGTISNQICCRCMEQKVVEWLRRKNPDYIPVVRRVGEFFDSYQHHEIDCITCGGSLNVCSKCYTLAMHKALRRNGILASEFLEFAAGKGFMLSSVKGVLNLKR